MAELPPFQEVLQYYYKPLGVVEGLATVAAELAVPRAQLRMVVVMAVLEVMVFTAETLVVVGPVVGQEMAVLELVQ